MNRYIGHCRLGGRPIRERNACAIIVSLLRNRDLRFRDTSGAFAYQPTIRFSAPNGASGPGQGMGVCEQNRDSDGLLLFSRFFRYVGRGSTSADNVRSVMEFVSDRRSMGRYGPVRFIAQSPETKGGWGIKSFARSFDAAVALRTSRKKLRPDGAPRRNRAPSSPTGQNRYRQPNLASGRNRETRSSPDQNRNRESNSSTD